MPPNNPNFAVGLPADAMRQLRKFSTTRNTRYYLYLAWIVFTAAVVLRAPLDTIEPVWHWLHRLSDFMAGFAPGLPAYLVNVAVRYPLEMLGVARGACIDLDSGAPRQSG